MQSNDKQNKLVYTKTVDSVFGARCLAYLSPDILCYLPPSNAREKIVIGDRKK